MKTEFTASEKRNHEWLFLVILVIPLLYIISVWGKLPDTVPLHFNMEGKADDWGSKWVLAALSCGISIPVYLLLYFVPNLDPKKKLDRSSKAYFMLRLAVTILLSAIGCWVIYSTVNYDGKNFSARLIPLLMSGLMIVMGNYLPTVKQNYFMGVRTPWTLENPQVWAKTHLLSGRLFFYAGFAALLIAAFVPEIVAIICVVALMLGVSVWSMVYSYRLYKKLQMTQ